VGCPLSPWNIADLQISQPESFCWFSCSPERSFICFCSCHFNH
jgi:hypothetical protein